MTAATKEANMFPAKRCAFGVLGFLVAVFVAGASTAGAQCAAPACPAANCFVDDATGIDTPICCTTFIPCKTIQAAINSASPGDVIEVAAGTYPETGGPLTVNKTLTLCGAQDGVDARTRVGAESIVSDAQGTYITASNVVVNGFTIRNSTAAAFTGYGLLMGVGTTGTRVLNNIIEDNIIGIGLANTGASQVLICQNLIQNNNNPGAASGTGIYTDQYVSGGATSNYLIEQNAFKGNVDAGIDVSNVDPPNPVSNLDISTNSFDMNGRAVVLFNTDMSTIHNNTITNCTLAGSGAIRLFGSVDDLTITSNDLNTGAGWGIRMTDQLDPPNTPNSDVVIHLNNIDGFANGGLFVGTGAHVGTVDAECNWWGDASGPFPVGTGEEVSGDADFTPWLVAPSPAPASGGGMCTGGATTTTTTTTSTTTTVTVTTSTTTTTAPQCGNGTIEFGEQCDPPGSSTCGAFVGGACGFDCQCPTTTTSTTIATTTTTSTTSTTMSTTTTTSTTSTTVSTMTATSTTAVTTSSTTTTTLCMSQPENTSPACGNMVDDDCDGLVDCADPDCSGIFPCPPAPKDPTIIKFGRAGTLDQIRGHAKLEMTPVDLTAMRVGVLLGNPNGVIYSGTLPAGALTAGSNGRIFRFRNPDARTGGGIYSVKIKQRTDRTSYTFSFASYGNLSAATDPRMRLQFYIGDDAAAAREGRVFITIDSPWMRTPGGWRAPKDH